MSTSHLLNQEHIRGSVDRLWGTLGMNLGGFGESEEQKNNELMVAQKTVEQDPVIDVQMVNGQPYEYTPGGWADLVLQRSGREVANSESWVQRVGGSSLGSVNPQKIDASSLVLDFSEEGRVDQEGLIEKIGQLYKDMPVGEFGELSANIRSANTKEEIEQALQNIGRGKENPTFVEMIRREQGGVVR